MNDFGFIITAYQQLDLVRSNISRIRNEYNHLNKSPIVVVSTSEDDIGFNKLYNEFKDVYVIQYPDAPGSTKSTFKSRPNNKPYISWRNEFLPARILLSLEKAIEFIYDNLGIKKIIHCHSDTYWETSKENNLVSDIKILDNCMAIFDTSEAEERCMALPPMMHIHPEGLLLNLDKCKENGYGFTFHNIFDSNSGFISHNYGSIEALIGQYAVYCLSGINITKVSDKVPDQYFQNIYFRCCRPYHCHTEFGLINLPGVQPDGK